MTGYDIWLLSALVVLAITTLAYTLASLTALLPSNGRDADGTTTRPEGAGAGDRPRRIERFVYRHHRLFGTAIVLGALLYLWRIASIGLLWPSAGHSAWLSGLPALTVLHLLVLPFGTVMLIRPSLLKRIEQTSNRWIDWQRGRTVHALRALLGTYCLVALA
ncbi:MAG: hypothetical protein WDZ60_01170, partial [Wenzhouxiangellaceae bacterium]